MKNIKSVNKIVIFLLVCSIFFPITGVFAHSSNQTLIILLKYSNETVFPKKIFILNTSFDEKYSEKTGEYLLEVYKENNSLLFTKTFDINPIILPSPAVHCIDPITYENTCDIFPNDLDESFAYITLPYSENISSIRLIKDSKLLFIYENSDFFSSQEQNSQTFELSDALLSLFLLFLLAISVFLIFKLKNFPKKTSFSIKKLQNK